MNLAPMPQRLPDDPDDTAFPTASAPSDSAARTIRLFAALSLLVYRASGRRFEWGGVDCSLSESDCQLTGITGWTRRGLGRQASVRDVRQDEGMRTVLLGDARVPVSALCLSCMFFGTRVDERTSTRLLDRYTAAGGAFLDTANNYAFWVPGGRGGESEKRPSKPSTSS